MRFEIQTKKKKKGGKYYILISYDAYGLTHIWGRYKTYNAAKAKMLRLRKKYG